MALEQVQRRSFSFGDFTIELQYNPARARSSKANVDPKAIAERPCFLCEKNRPKEQEALSFLGRYDILLNPYPIAYPHFTMASKEHIPQELLPHLHDMLTMKDAIDEIALFYNGGQCGASAPDHFHFQGVRSQILPIVEDFENIGATHAELLMLKSEEHKAYKRFIMRDYLRSVLIVSSHLSEDFYEGMHATIERLALLDPLAPKPSSEPKMNVIINKTAYGWQGYIFPRQTLRPWQYFAQGEARRLISPASLEMAGILVTPEKEDFDRLTAEDIGSIYKQVSVPEDKLRALFTDRP